MVGSNVLITTSGVGSRLGELTRFTNKSLIKVGDKPALGHIIDSYPVDSRFIITVGHFGDHVKQYVSLIYPDRDVVFVDVPQYVGPGSSLLCSLLCAKDHLNAPFIFHACDTILSRPCKQVIKTNWVVGCIKTAFAHQYRTLVSMSGGMLNRIEDKGAISFDHVYPGVCGVYDHKKFWKVAADLYAQDSDDSSKSDCDVINELLRQNVKFQIIDRQDEDDWFDIGNVDSLERARVHFKSEHVVLEKPDEALYMQRGYVVKFFHDDSIVSKRVERARCLDGIVPSIRDASKNFYTYCFVNGSVFSRTVTPGRFFKFLNWARDVLWHDVDQSAGFIDACRRFYCKKTHERVERYLAGDVDRRCVINGTVIPPVLELLESTFCDDDIVIGINKRFHGDLILDNIIDTGTAFKLIDWRHDFGGSTDMGDVYYDLAKLNHNLIFNHDRVDKNAYTLEQLPDGSLRCDIDCSKNLIDCRDVLRAFCQSNGYDWRKVNILTALIWLNMAPLHDRALGRFLFNMGKYNLYRMLDELSDG